MPLPKPKPVKIPKMPAKDSTKTYSTTTKEVLVRVGSSPKSTK